MQGLVARTLIVVWGLGACTPRHVFVVITWVVETHVLSHMSLWPTPSWVLVACIIVIV